MALLIHHILRIVSAPDQKMSLEILVLCLGLDTYLVIIGSLDSVCFCGVFFDKWIVEYWAPHCCKWN